jgi:hypothetical protein
MGRSKSVGIRTDFGFTESRSETSDSSIFFEAKRQISTLIIPNRKSDEGCEDMKISRHMGVGDIERHTGRSWHFWGIGSRLGHPSKCQNRPRTRRNHITIVITASRTMLHEPMHVHMGEIPPSFDGIAQKQNARGRGGERDGSGRGGGYLRSVFYPRETHTRRLVDISTHIFRRHKFRETRR